MKFLSGVIYAIAASHVIRIISGNPESTENFPHSAVLDHDDKICLYWKFNETYITFELHGNTDGWIGFGISPNGGMIGADIYVGWVKNGIAYISDRHGISSNTFPPEDPEQNVELLEGRECDGWTVIKFQRQIVGCENSYDVTIGTNKVNVIWALGHSDPIGRPQTSLDYHDYGSKFQGGESLFLLKPHEPCSSTSDDIEGSFDVLNDKFEVPAKRTYYNCRLLKLPEFKSKHHIVKVEAVFENPKYVHHVNIFMCRYGKPNNPANVGRNRECDIDDNLYPDFHRCDMYFGSSAVGTKSICLPSHVGYPVGPDEPQYVYMETHYNNPMLKEDIVDNSGLRFYYTGQLRRFDGGTMELGLVVTPHNQIIPPNLESFNSYGECSKQCLEDGMASSNTSKINIIGIVLHAHVLGKQLILHHVSRDGAHELQPVFEDLSYDFNHQSMQHFAKEVVVNSGDSLQLQCNYNSKSRKNFTLGGFGTDHEMCKAFMLYYPKIPLSYCTSTPDHHEVYKFFGLDYLDSSNVSFNDRARDMDIFASNPTIYDAIKKQNWTQQYSEKFSKHVQHVLRHPFCVDSTRSRQNKVTDSFIPPNITHPYLPPEQKCVQPSIGKTTNRLETSCFN